MIKFIRSALSVAMLMTVAVQGSAQTTVKTSGDRNFFNHLDVSATVGSTGLGFDFAMPINDIVQVRTGAAFFPHVKMKMNYGMEMTGNRSDVDPQTMFQKAAEVLKSAMGRDVTSEVSMWAMPNYDNFKLLVDVFPFRDKRWHVTGGFYIGNSNFAKAYNCTEDMQNLLGVNLYNHMIDKLVANEDIFTWEGQSVSIPSELIGKALDYGYMGVPFGTLKNDVVKDGQVIYHRGDTYYAKPGDDNMIRVNGYINKFKPYVGFGYGGHLFKGSDTMISFDAGLMFWGGSPKLVTHDGVDLVHDLPRIRGDVGRSVNLIKSFEVFPVLNLRLTQRIF